MAETRASTNLSRPLRVFLCHSSGDKPSARDLYRRLKADGFAPWLDEEELLPGQDWQREIPAAIRVCDAIVICLSQKSVTKEGYVQREVEEALKVAQEKPEGTIFIIPVRLEEVEAPKRLGQWQCADMFDESGYQRLVRALTIRANAIAAAVAAGGAPPPHESGRLADTDRGSPGAISLQTPAVTPAQLEPVPPAAPGAGTTANSPGKTPSLVFVFGAPLGDNHSPTWVMLLLHYGPSTAHNCKIEFLDDDRKNIKHQWLIKHPDSPFPPAGLVGESRKSIRIGEAGPEGAIGNFQWSPVDPDRQHYTVNISSRDGAFVEKWEVTRVDGVLRTKIMIEHGVRWVQNNPGLDRVVFRREDAEFTSTPLATSLPQVSYRNVHPGWKPSHRFEAPVAIIDPEGYVQVMTGVKSPDGSTRTDFGCWDTLTKHFGESPHE